MLSDKEKKLIVHLRNNSRAKINQFAKDNSMPVSSMFDTMHRLEEQGIVQHTTSIAFQKVGFPVRMHIAVKTNKEEREKLKTYLQSRKEINNLHVINSGFDFHMEAVFKNNKEALDMLDEMNQKNTILQSNVYQIIETVHENRFLSDVGHF